MGKASILCFCLAVGALTYLLLGFVQIWKGTSKSGTSVQAIIINLVHPLAHTRLISSLCEIPCWKHVAQMWKQQVNGDITHIDLEESCVEILLSIVGVAFLIGLLFRSVAGIFFTAIALIAYIPMKYENDCRKLKLEVSHSMPGIYRTLSVALGSGQTLSQAIEYVGNHSHGAVAQYFIRASLKLRCGMPVESVVEELACDLSVPGSSLLATALVISHRTGSPLRNLFLRTATLVERQSEFERLLSVKTAQVRLSARIVCLLPLLLIGVLSLISPDFQKGLTTTTGIICTLLALGMDAGALVTATCFSAALGKRCCDDAFTYRFYRRCSRVFNELGMAVHKCKKSHPETWSSESWLEIQAFRLLVSRNLEHGGCLKNSKRSDQTEENCTSTERYY